MKFRLLSRFSTEKLRKIFWMLALLAVFINLYDDVNIYLRNRAYTRDREWVDMSFRERRHFERLVALFFSEDWESPTVQTEARRLIDELKANTVDQPEARAAVDRLIAVIATPFPNEVRRKAKPYRESFQGVRRQFEAGMEKRIENDMQGNNHIESMILGANIVDLFLIFFLLVVYFLERNMKDQIEDALSRTTDDLRSSNARLRDMTSSRARRFRLAAHDIKSPLAALKGYSEIARESTGSNHQISSLLQRMDSLTASTLDMVNTLFADEIEDSPQANVNLDKVLNEVCTASSTLAKRKNQRIDFIGEGPTSAIVLGNRTELLTCFYNLIGNAIKYSPVGGKIDVRWRLDRNQVVISIRDQGPGFRPQDFKEMFAEGKTLSAQPTGGELSSGYGLYSSKKIIEEHHGTISIQNAEKHGAVVNIELPSLPGAI